jgi:hypothetical protein
LRKPARDQPFAEIDAIDLDARDDATVTVTPAGG